MKGNLMPNIPRFYWWIIGAVVVLIVVVLLRVSIGIGPEGFHITQSLVR